MCLLWCYNTLRRDGCKGIFPNCACASVVAVVVLGPLGLLFGLLAAILLGLAKWLPGSFHRVSTCCACYCEVIQKGQEQYDIEDGVQRRPPPQQSRMSRWSPTDYVERQTRATSSKCAGESYCCCLPVFWLLMLLYPVWILVELLICGGPQGACEGMNAGCAGTKGWRVAFRRALLVIDRTTSQSAYGHPTPWFPAKDEPGYAAPGQAPPLQTPAGFQSQAAFQAAAPAYPPQPPVTRQPPVPAMPPRPPMPTAYAQPVPAQPVAYAQPVAASAPPAAYPAKGPAPRRY